MDEKPSNAVLAADVVAPEVPAAETPGGESVAGTENGQKPAAQEPDYEALYRRDDFWEKTLAHEKARAAIDERADHKFKSQRQVDFDRAVEQRVNERLTTANQQQLEDRIASIPEDDLDELAKVGQLTRQQVIQERGRRADVARQEDLAGAIARTMWDTTQQHLLGDLPEAERKSIKIRNEDGMPRTIKDIVADANKVRAQLGAAKLKDEITKDLLPALKAQILAELRGGEESPITIPGSAGLNISSIYEAEAAHAAGTISNNEMRQYRRQFNVDF